MGTGPAALTGLRLSDSEKLLGEEVTGESLMQGHDLVRFVFWEEPAAGRGLERKTKNEKVHRGHLICSKSCSATFSVKSFLLNSKR